MSNKCICKTLFLFLLGVSIPVLIDAANNGCTLKCPTGSSHPFEANKAYEYEFKTEQNLSWIEVNSDTPQSLKIQGKLELTTGEGENHCVIYLAITKWTSSNIAGVFEVGKPNLLIQSHDLSLPVKFSYINGKIEEICLPEDDVWKNNIRRSIVSIFQTQNDNEVSTEKTKIITEEDIFGKFRTMYYKSGDQVHKTRITGQMFWKSIGISDYVPEPTVNLPPNGASIISAKTFFESYVSHMNEDDLLGDSIMRCSFKRETKKIINEINCQEFQIHNGVEIRSNLQSTLFLTLLGATQTQSKSQNYPNLIQSTLLYDHDFETPSKDTQLHKTFSDVIIGTELCKHVKGSRTGQKFSDFLSYVEGMKKIVKRIPKNELEKNFNHVKNTLDCKEETRERQVQIYLDIIAASPTDTTVGFFVDQVLQGNVNNDTFEVFISKLPFAPFPSSKMLAAIERLISNLNSISFEIEKEEVILLAAGVVKKYRKRYDVDSSFIKDHLELNHLITTINSIEGLEKFHKINIQKNMMTISEKEEIGICDTLAEDDLDKLRCYPICGEKSRKFAESLLLDNLNSATSDVRITAYLFLRKCPRVDNIASIAEKVFRETTDERVKSFVQNNIEAVSGPGTDLQIGNDFNNLHSKFNPTTFASKTFVFNAAFENFVKHKSRIEINYVADASKIPKLLTLKRDIYLHNLTVEMAEVSIFLTNDLELLISIQQFGVITHSAQISLNPMKYMDMDMKYKDISIETLFQSLTPQLMELWDDIVSDKKLSILNINDADFSELSFAVNSALPTISGLPFRMDFESGISSSLELETKGLSSIGNQEIDANVYFSPIFSTNHREIHSIFLGTSQIVGHQTIEKVESFVKVNFGLKKSNGGPITFSISFPKKTDDEKMTFEMKLRTESQEVQFLDNFMKEETSLAFNIEHMILQEPIYLESLADVEFFFGMRRKLAEMSPPFLEQLITGYLGEWQMTISSSLTNSDSRNKSLEIKFHPENSTEENTVRLNLDFVPSTGIGHQINLSLQRPGKKYELLWSLMDEHGKHSASLTGAISNQRLFKAEAYFLRFGGYDVEEERGYFSCSNRGRGGLLCRWPICLLCDVEYKFGMSLKSPDDPHVGLIILEGEIKQEFEDKVDIFLQSKGIHRFLDSKLHATFSSEGIINPKYNNGFGVHSTLQVKNSFLGGIISNLSFFPFQNDSDASKFIWKLEYGREFPYENFLIETSHVETYKLSSINTTGVDTVFYSIKNFSTVHKFRSSQFPILSYDLTDESTMESHMEGEQVDSNIYPKYPPFFIKRHSAFVIIPISLPNHRMTGTIDRQWKSLDYEDLDFSSNVEVLLEKNGKTDTISTKVGVKRKDKSFELVDLGLRLGMLLSSSLYYVKENEISLKGKIFTDAFSHSMNHYAKKVSDENWSYKGDHEMIPGGKYSTSGIFSPSPSSLIYFRSFDVKIGEKSSSNPVQISFNEMKSDSSIKWKLALVDKFFTHFESSVQLDKSSSAFEANILMKDYFKTQVNAKPGELNFITNLSERNFLVNGTVNFAKSLYENQFLIAKIYWINANDPSENGNISSETRIKVELKPSFESVTNFTISERTSEIKILIAPYIENEIHNVFYIYLKDPDNQKYGIKGSANMVQYSEESSEHALHDFSISINAERPTLQPFILEFFFDSLTNQTLLTWDILGTFSLKDNVFYLFPCLSTTAKMTFKMTNYRNFSGNAEIDYNQIEASIKADGSQSLQETFLYSKIQLEKNYEHYQENWTYTASLENSNLKKEVFFRSYSNNEIMDDTKDEEAKDSDIEQETRPEGMLEHYLSTKYFDETLMRYYKTIDYRVVNFNRISNTSQTKIKGHHKFTRYFESWKNFEFAGDNDITYYSWDTSELSCNSNISRVSTSDLTGFHFSSDHSLKKFDTENDSDVLYSTKGQILVESNHVHTTPDLGKVDLTVHLNSNYDNLKIRIGNAYNITSTGSNYITNFDSNILNVFFINLKNDFQLAEHSTQLMSCNNKFLLDYGGDIKNSRNTIDCECCTVYGIIEDVAELVHHDMSLVFSKYSKQTVVNSSFTLSSSAFSPQITEVRYNWLDVISADETKDKFWEQSQILLSVGKIKEFECKKKFENWNYLSGEAKYFDQDVEEAFEKFFKNKLYCNPHKLAAKPSFRNADGRLFFENVSRNETQTIENDTFEAIWVEENCNAEFVDNAGHFKNLSNYCTTALNILKHVEDHD